MINAARHDYDVCRRLDTQTYYDMMGVTSRLHKGTLDEPEMYYRPGKTPNYVEFRASTSALNVAKIMLLQHKDHGMHQLWAHTLAKREAKASVNSMLGGEIGDLLAIADANEVLTP